MITYGPGFHDDIRREVKDDVVKTTDICILGDGETYTDVEDCEVWRLTPAGEAAINERCSVKGSFQLHEVPVQFSIPALIKFFEVVSARDPELAKMVQSAYGPVQMRLFVGA